VGCGRIPRRSVSRSAASGLTGRYRARRTERH